MRGNESKESCELLLYLIQDLNNQGLLRPDTVAKAKEYFKER